MFQSAMSVRQALQDPAGIKATSAVFLDMVRGEQPLCYLYSILAGKVATISVGILKSCSFQIKASQSRSDAFPYLTEWQLMSLTATMWPICIILPLRFAFETINKVIQFAPQHNFHPTRLIGHDMQQQKFYLLTFTERILLVFLNIKCQRYHA